jgi:hypothetical protein
MTYEVKASNCASVVLLLFSKCVKAEATGMAALNSSPLPQGPKPAIQILELLALPG